VGSSHEKFLTLTVLADCAANFSKKIWASFWGGEWDFFGGAFRRFGVSRRTLDIKCPQSVEYHDEFFSFFTIHVRKLSLARIGKTTLLQDAY